MRFELTRIEILDTQHAGLADDVRKWLTQGITVAKIVTLILEKYQLSLSPGALWRFRCKCWMRELELLREKKITLLAEQEIARERAVKASLAHRAMEGGK
jgi:hypothetical protein